MSANINIEHALLKQVIDTKDFHTLQKLQIDESYFSSPEAQEVYRFIRETFYSNSSYGDVPSAEMVKLKFPNFMFVASHDSVAVLCNHLRQERLKIDVLKLAQELTILAQNEPKQAVSIIRAESAKLASLIEVGEDLSMSSAYQQLLENYESVQNSQGVLGIPYPWDIMNDETQGMLDGQFIVLYGRPKSMKTWIAISMAVHAYLFARKRVLFYTREMPPLLVAQRVAAAITKVDYGVFKKGKLQPEIKDQVFAIIKSLLDDEKLFNEGGKHAPAFMITSDRSAVSDGNGGGIGWLHSKVRDFKPDLLVVDGMYLMKDDRSGKRDIDWKTIAHISQDLKLTAQQFNIPLIGVTQANRASENKGGEDLTELAYADALGQDADAVIRISKKEHVGQDNIKRTELHLTFPGIREAKLDGIVVRGEPASDFTYQRSIVVTEKDQNDSEYSKKPTAPFKKQTDPKVTMKVLKSV